MRVIVGMNEERRIRASAPVFANEPPEINMKQRVAINDKKFRCERIPRFQDSTTRALWFAVFKNADHHVLVPIMREKRSDVFDRVFGQHERIPHAGRVEFVELPM